MSARRFFLKKVAGSAALVLLLGLALPLQAGEMTEVVMDKMMFVPQQLKIRAGTTVTWVNKEKRGYHTVLFEKEGLAESDTMFYGESWQRKFDKPGKYPYRCGPHPMMTGIIEVTE